MKKEIKNIVSNLSKETLEQLVLDIHDTASTNSNNISNYRIANIVKNTVNATFMKAIHELFPEDTKVEFIDGEFKGMEGKVIVLRHWDEEMDKIVCDTSELLIKLDLKPKFIDRVTNKGIPTKWVCYKDYSISRLFEQVKFIR